MLGTIKKCFQNYISSRKYLKVISLNDLCVLLLLKTKLVTGNSNPTAKSVTPEPEHAEEPDEAAETVVETTRKSSISH
jgi:hypothetical protein